MTSSREKEREEKEEGEWSQDDEMQDLATGKNEDHFDAGDVTEERIENSMAKFKDYFDGKFDNLAKVMELDELSVFNNNVDDNYLLVASHVDETTKQKITVMNILTLHDFCIKIGQEVMKITREWLWSIKVVYPIGFQ